MTAPVDIFGWKLVPDSPTEQMWQAGRSADAHPGDSYSKVWRAMFDAAPNVDDCETASKATSPADLAEECAKIAEGHVGAYDWPEMKKIVYNEACRDIAKAIRDAMGGKA